VITKISKKSVDGFALTGYKVYTMLLVPKLFFDRMKYIFEVSINFLVHIRMFSKLVYGVFQFPNNLPCCSFESRLVNLEADKAH
jgi:hypothetical protein